MKITSIIFTPLLLVPALYFIIATCQIFYKTTSDLIPGDVRFAIAKPSIICAVSFIVFLILSILLNIKRKFAANIAITACLLLVYLVMIIFVDNKWFA